MAVAPPSTVLGCGRDIDQVWDHLGRAPDAHELTCPYCRAARADLADLGRAARAMRDDDLTNPDAQPGPGVLDRILAVVHAEVRRGRRLPLDQPGPDGTSPSTVSEQTVNSVVRRVGDRSRHVQIRRCALTLDDSADHAGGAGRRATDGTSGAVVKALAGADSSAVPGEDSGHGPAVVTVSLRVSIAYDAPIIETSGQLRRAVIAAIEEEVGMDVSSVDIHIEDLHDD